MSSQTPCAQYDFRANQDTMTKETIDQFLRLYCKKWTYQLEQGQDTGYIHWQGKFSLIKKKRNSELLPLFCANYLQPSASKTFDYVMKQDTRLEGPYTNKDAPAMYVPVQYRHKTLRRWQEHLIQVSMMQRHDPRTINVLYCPQGNIGKTTLCGYLYYQRKGFLLPSNLDSERLVATACNIFKAQNNNDPGIIFIDIPRSQEQTRMYALYQAIEQLKNGMLFDTRYHYQSWDIDTPVIWVFTNKIPDLSQLSQDRWKIWTVHDVDQEMVLMQDEF